MAAILTCRAMLNHRPLRRGCQIEFLYPTPYKTELIRNPGPWKGIDDVEYAMLVYIDWFNHRRLLEPIGYVTPAEHEEAYRIQHDPSYADGPTELSLR